MALLGEAPSEYELEVEEGVKRLRISAEAKRRFRAEQTAELPIPEFASLTDLLDRPWPEEKELVRGLWPKDGRVFFSAGAKVGKTTLVANVIRSLVDSEPFLGAHEVMPLSGKVALLNFELSPQKMVDWLRDVGIKNTDKLSVINLRGQASTFDIREPRRRAEWAKLLRDNGVQVVVWDCVTPVLSSLGLDENNEIRNLLYPFDELLAEAGASEGLIVHHMGHANGRPRGDSAAIGWPDALWYYEKDATEKVTSNEAGIRVITSEVRKFWAEGRDVSVDKTPLSYDHNSRRLSVMDMEAKRDREDVTKAEKILAFVKENPAKYSRRDLCDEYQRIDMTQAEVRRLLYKTTLLDTYLIETESGRKKVLIAVEEQSHEKARATTSGQHVRYTGTL